MPVTFTFHTIEEKKPKHDQEIVYLRIGSEFGYAFFEPKVLQAEYRWEEIDEDGYPTGDDVIYNGESPKEMEGHKLILLDEDGWELDNKALWMPVSEWLEIQEKILGEENDT
jgi:hypothetical protein